MADDVTITGLGTGVAPWATEKTQKMLGANIEKMVKILNDKAKAQDPATIKKLNDEQEKMRKLLQESNTELDTKTKKEKKKDTDADIKQKKQDDLDKRKLFQQNKSVGTIGTLSSIATTGITKLFTPTTLLAGGFGLAAYEVENFGKYIEKTYNSFIDLYNSGITFSKGMFDFRIAATNAALPLADFAKLLLDNSAVVASFGEGGANALGQISKSTIDLVHNQMKLGMGYKDINTYLGSYLENARMQGFLDRMTNEQRAAEGAKYIQELTLYSQVLGKSRQQIDEETQKAARRPDIYQVLSSLPTDIGNNAKAAFTKSTAAFSGVMGNASGEFNDMFDQVITSFNPMQSDSMKALNAANPEAARAVIDYANSIKNGTVTQEEVNAKVANIVSLLQKSDDNTLSTLTQNQGLWKQGTQDVSHMLQNVRSINAENLNALRQGKFATLQPIELAIQKLGDIFRTVQTKFEGIFAKFVLDNIGTFEGIATNFANYASTLADKLQEFLTFVSKMFNPATRDAAINEITTSLNSWIDKILDHVFNYIKHKLNPFETSKGTSSVAGKFVEDRMKVAGLQPFDAAAYRKNKAIASQPSALNPDISNINVNSSPVTPISGIQFAKGSDINNIINQPDQDTDSNQVDNNLIYQELMKSNTHLQNLVTINNESNDKINMIVNNGSTANNYLKDNVRAVKTNSNTIR